MKVRFELEIVDGQYLLTILGSGGSKDVKKILNNHFELRDVIWELADKLQRRQDES